MISRLVLFHVFGALLFTVVAAFNPHEWAANKVSPLSQDWIHYDDSLMWIYGAYWDHREREGEFSVEKIGNPPYVRILMLVPYTKQSKPLVLQSKCKFYYSEIAKTETTDVLAAYNSTHDDMYSDNWSQPYFLYCKPPVQNPQYTPMSVSFYVPEFYKKKWQKDFNGFSRDYMFPIRGNALPDKNSQENTPRDKQQQADGTITIGKNNTTTTSAQKSKFLAVCVKPMRYGPYEKINEFIQFFSFYDAMGVDHFILYDSGSATPMIYKLINDMIDLGISIEMRSWNFRERHGWENQQTISTEACGYEAMFAGYENLLVIDYDELIILKSNAVPGVPLPTLPQFIRAQDTLHPDAAFYVFQNAFFVLQAEDAQNSTGSISALKKVQHAIPTPIKNGRFKCIYKPRRMDRLYTHGGVPARNIWKEVVIPYEVAAMHHYRHVPKPGVLSTDFTVIDMYTELFLNNRFYKSTFRA